MSRSIIKFNSQKDQRDYYFLFSHNAVYAGTELPMSLPLDLSAFIAYEFKMGNDVSYLKAEFQTLESKETLLPFFKWENFTWLERFIENMIVQSGTSILAVENEALSNEINEWLSNESMKYDQDWLVERIRNRHKFSGFIRIYSAIRSND